MKMLIKINIAFWYTVILQKTQTKIFSGRKGHMEMRKLRRKDRILSEEETQTLLHKGTYGVLSTVSAEGEPYGVPLSYLWLDGSVYFHSALKGHKVDNIRAGSRASFTVVGDIQPVYDKTFSTYYESAIVFGAVEEVTDEKERYNVLYALAEKYLPEQMEHADSAIHATSRATLVCAIRPEGISGKAKKRMP